MIEKLIKYINTKVSKPLTAEEIKLITFSFTYKKIRKHQYFLQSGDICNIAGFIVKGSMKKYTIDNLGKENILDLYLENWWVGDKESFITGKPSQYNIDAIEDTEIYIIQKDNFHKYIEHLPFFNELNQQLTEKHSFQLIKRLHNTKTLSAEEKLTELYNQHPEFFIRFPQHLIASYLGMTKETLSRIRSKSIKK